MFFKTETSTYEAKMIDGKIILEKTEMSGNSSVDIGSRKEGECLVITPEGAFLFNKSPIPMEGDRFTRGVVRIRDGEVFSPEIITSPVKEL